MSLPTYQARDDTNICSLHPKDVFLLAMSDDGLDEFQINEEPCRAKLFDAMKVDFDSFGPVASKEFWRSWSTSGLRQLYPAKIVQAKPLPDNCRSGAGKYVHPQLVLPETNSSGINL